jgi:hypothetical protein
MDILGKSCLWIALLGGWLCFTAVAQEDAGKAQAKEVVDPKTTTRITLGSTSGTPGTSVVVPIYFSPMEGAKVGRLKIVVNFVSANVKFDKLERGIAAEMGDVEVTSDLKLGKNDKGVETSTLTAEAVAPEAPKKGIAAGLLAYISLKISDTGRPAQLTLRTTAEATEFGTNKPLTNVRAFDAQVEVLAPGTQPAVACFFFSH